MKGSHPATGRQRERALLGWREWVFLPGLGPHPLKAKVDTGARSSSLHAFDLETFSLRGQPMVRFVVHPIQRSRARAFLVEHALQDERVVRSSSGHESLRPVIVTEVRLAELVYPIELTLTNRDEMGFRMLLGRQALRGRFLVDPGRSYLTGRRTRSAVASSHGDP